MKVCTCGHDISFHTDKGCDFEIDDGFSWSYCDCNAYVEKPCEEKVQVRLDTNETSNVDVQLKNTNNSSVAQQLQEWYDKRPYTLRYVNPICKKEYDKLVQKVKELEDKIK